mmetsp:Transcript_22099/g.48493  ORF Transcript_22099/g.48493 Transcript_22099/m.48493 type:complete len:242 (-) Transcript_22099:879-1604(-)
MISAAFAFASLSPSESPSSGSYCTALGGASGSGGGASWASWAFALASAMIAAACARAFSSARRASSAASCAIWAARASACASLSSAAINLLDTAAVSSSVVEGVAAVAAGVASLASAPTPRERSALHTAPTISSSMKGVMYTSAIRVSTAATVHPHITLVKVKRLAAGAVRGVHIIKSMSFVDTSVTGATSEVTASVWLFCIKVTSPSCKNSSAVLMPLDIQSQNMSMRWLTKPAPASMAP